MTFHFRGLLRSPPAEGVRLTAQFEFHSKAAGEAIQKQRDRWKARYDVYRHIRRRGEMGPDLRAQSISHRRPKAKNGPTSVANLRARAQAATGCIDLEWTTRRAPEALKKLDAF